VGKVEKKFVKFFFENYKKMKGTRKTLEKIFWRKISKKNLGEAKTWLASRFL